MLLPTHLFLSLLGNCPSLSLEPAQLLCTLEKASLHAGKRGAPSRSLRTKASWEVNESRQHAVPRREWGSAPGSPGRSAFLGLSVVCRLFALLGRGFCFCFSHAAKFSSELPRPRTLEVSDHTHKLVETFQNKVNLAYTQADRNDV